jgi:cell pole-organizing protein PopZ
MFEPEPEPEPFFEPEPEPEPEPVFAPEPEPEPEPEEDILELTDDMVAEDDSYMEEIPELREPAPRMAMADLDIEEDAESILAAPVQVASTTALAELARAVARERGVGLGRGGLTLEDLTREILRTLIKDWLDQNLPYMIERIVKKEIEKMVNRAEKL